MNYFYSCNLELQYQRLGTIVSHNRKKKNGLSISRLMGVEITIVGDTLLCGLEERY